MHLQLSRDSFSTRDRKVLDSLFIPFQIGGNHSEAFTLEIETEVTDVISEVKTPKEEESVKLELEGIELAESGNLEEAIILFGKAIEMANRASIYNNRAQALRLKGNDEGALHDLITSIDLSAHQPRTRCQALCQRGLLYRKINNVSNAQMDFEEASKIGSKFAKNQLVEMNPYAALCNQMLQAAFLKMQ